ncbi:MAG: hypothetical protein K2X09_01710 [Rickettsiales bacterium]|nr:hypothetical protein [Rickettsiales bacterium]
MPGTVKLTNNNGQALINEAERIEDNKGQYIEVISSYSLATDIPYEVKVRRLEDDKLVAYTIKFGSQDGLNFRKNVNTEINFTKLANGMTGADLIKAFAARESSLAPHVIAAETLGGYSPLSVILDNLPELRHPAAR